MILIELQEGPNWSIQHINSQTQTKLVLGTTGTKVELFLLTNIIYGFFYDLWKFIYARIKTPNFNFSKYSSKFTLYILYIKCMKVLTSIPLNGSLREHCNIDLVVACLFDLVLRLNLESLPIPLQYYALLLIMPYPLVHSTLLYELSDRQIFWTDAHIAMVFCLLSSVFEDEGKNDFSIINSSRPKSERFLKIYISIGSITWNSFDGLEFSCCRFRKIS